MGAVIDGRARRANHDAAPRSRGGRPTGDAVQEILLLKAAILGGGSDKISKKEILDLRAYLVLLKVEAKDLLPYAQLFKFKKEAGLISKTMIDEGFSHLNVSLKKLLKASQVYRSEYQFADLQRLISTLNILDEKQSDLFSVANKLKDLLVGNQALRTEVDYAALVDNLTEVLKLYSVQVQGYVKFEISTPSELDQTIQYAESWLNLLENSVQFKRSKVISVETIDPLVKEISSSGLIPIKVKPETLVSFYKLLIVRAFEAGVTGDVNNFAGLSKSHFSQIRREIAILKIYLHSIRDVGVGERIKMGDLRAHLKAYRPQSEIYKKLDESSQKTALAAFEEMKAEILTARPVIYRHNKMLIAADQERADQNWQELVHAAYVKFLSRELLIGWGSGFSSKLVAKASISETQLVQWYADFKQFGIEVKTFDPRSQNSGAVSFKQANLLTYSADGDDKMNYLETVQFLNMLVSGGGETLPEMQNGFAQAKCELSEKDTFDNKWLDERCMTTDLRNNFKTYFSNLPFLVDYTSRLTNDQFFAFYYDVMSVTRVDARLQGRKVETADLRAMSILFHYIESLYSTFDADGNGGFSPAEIRSAYPRFQIFAKKYAYDNAKDQIDKFNGTLAQTVGGYSCYSENDLIRESFVFLVYNGKSPQQSDLNKFPCFLRKSLIDFSGEVSRAQIINTFKILKSVLGS